MATAKEFLAQVKEIEGVAGCLLVRENGHVIAQMVEDYELLSSLLSISGKHSRSIMEKAGFTYLRGLSFERGNGQNFHLFPVSDLYLGIVQSQDCPTNVMLKRVDQLLCRVKTE